MTYHMPRFRTREDALLFMECLQSKQEFPSEKIIHPFLIMDGVSILNEEYEDAPFELGLIAKEVTL